MRRLLAVLALLLVACPRAPEEPPPEPPSGIQGSLTVNVRDARFVPWASMYSVYVLLGDGSRFKQPLDRTGIVHFQDAAIVGPQDVSVVMYAKDGLSMGVHTFLAIDQPEAWVSITGELEATEPPTPPKLATVSGRVTGIVTGNPVQVFVVGQGLTGGGPVARDGSFRFDVLGAEPGQVDLVAREERYDVESQPLGEVLARAGRLRNLTLGRDQELSGQVIALDQVPDQSLSVTVPGAERYASRPHVVLDFHEGNLGFFSTYAKGTSPLSVPTLAMTVPFDTTRRSLFTRVGHEDALPAGYAHALTPIDNGPSATVTLLSPMTSSSPVLGACNSPPITPLSGFGFQWSIDAAATVGQLRFVGRSPAGVGFSWYVTAPSSITSFTPFPLPSEVSPRSGFPRGSYQLKLLSSFRGDASGYASHFARDVSAPSFVEARGTELTGCFLLE
jgi:hypothetical protein